MGVRGGGGGGGGGGKKTRSALKLGRTFTSYIENRL